MRPCRHRGARPRRPPRRSAARRASARPGPAGEPDRRRGHLRPRDAAAHRLRQRRGALPGPGAPGAADHLRRGRRRDPRRGTAGADRPGRRRAPRRRRGADPRPDRRPDHERAAPDRRTAADRRRRGPPRRGRYATLYRTVASSCTICAENPTPTWALRASRVTDDTWRGASTSRTPASSSSACRSATCRG